MIKEIQDKNIFMYVNYSAYDLSIGISKKINSQIIALRKMGYNVTYSSYLKDGVCICDNYDNVIFKKKHLIKNQLFIRYFRRFLLIKTTTSYIKKHGRHFNYCYLRWHSFDIPYINMLKQMNKNDSKIIVEAHAYTPNLKAVSLIGKYTVFADKIFSRFAKKYVDLIAAIADYDYIWGIKTVKIDNAVNVDSNPLRKWKKIDNQIRFISVANESLYHGYDRLLKGVKKYYENNGKRKLQINFVGVYLKETKDLVKTLGLNDIVVFHGKKIGDDLDEVYNNSDLGIGALAHHRVGLYSGSSLKTKEYFAKGVPFIYGWRELSFDDTFKYAKRVPLNEDPIDIQKIINFYDSIVNDDNMILDMRRFAEANFTWEAQMEKIFSQI